VSTAGREVAELIRYAGTRLVERMDGLGDTEWSWTPIGDDRVSIRWRLDHVAEMLVEPRNREWLGIDPGGAVPARPAASAAEAVASVAAGLDDLLGVVAAVDDVEAVVGIVGGPYSASTRLAYVLHVADELVHHGAEAALLRDLYAGRATGD
jgi:hypothetical protein